MDLIVTTPKPEAANSAREAANVIRDGGGTYFRFLGQRLPSNFRSGVSRLYYVQDGFIRGFAVISSIDNAQYLCMTTNRQWPQGYYAVMDARTWTWIKPIPMKGFQAWRYFTPPNDRFARIPVEIVGNWLDPMPKVL